MQQFLTERLEALEWPLDTGVSFEVSEDGSKVMLDVELPDIDEMPIKSAKVNKSKLAVTISDLTKTKQQQNYLLHIHSIGFRLIGEVFYSLPTVQEVTLSAYAERICRKTGYQENEYLYSVRVLRDEWLKLNFDNLEMINLLDCFGMFDLRRNVTKQGIIHPIEPFQ